MTTTDLLKKVRQVEYKTSTLWHRGVRRYAIELMESLINRGITDVTKDNLEELLLNGTEHWLEYSKTQALQSDELIAERLFPKPKRRMNFNWFVVQASALHQAYLLLTKLIK